MHQYILHCILLDSILRGLNTQAIFVELNIFVQVTKIFDGSTETTMVFNSIMVLLKSMHQYILHCILLDTS